MGDAVVAALVAGVVSLVVTGGRIWWESRQAREQRRLAARERLDAFREPLLTAVDDLGSRINNIRNDAFGAYLNGGERERTAVLGTLFRFAQFFGWTEVLYGSGGRLRFESDASTRVVADTLFRIRKALASDDYDRLREHDFRTTRLMIWQEEQRAIGELMQVDAATPRCVSFDSFVTDYEARYARWFETFASELRQPSVPDSNRLAKLQDELAQLVRELDVDAILVRIGTGGAITEPRWARSAMMAGKQRPDSDSTEGMPGR
jgi:hypothetical protein